jgi:hypothetical protein
VGKQEEAGVGARYALPPLTAVRHSVTECGRERTCPIRCNICCHSPLVSSEWGLR